MTKTARHRQVGSQVSFITRKQILWSVIWIGLVAWSLTSILPAEQEAQPSTEPSSAKAGAAKQASEAKTQVETPSAEGLKKISAENDVWLDMKWKGVVVDGQVCLRQGQLEMFACPKGTKEHESVVSLNCTAQEIHTGLLAVGGMPGTPVVFNPEYKPATGQLIDIYVLWKNEQGATQQVRAQDWVKNHKSGQAMSYDWVFAGSGFWKDDEGKEHYKANSGDLICVSNFPTATLDLPVKSSEANDELMFACFTDRIPPKGTKIRLVLIPRVEKKAESK